jgi:hypothetical protein
MLRYVYVCPCFIVSFVLKQSWFSYPLFAGVKKSFFSWLLIYVVIYCQILNFWKKIRTIWTPYFSGLNIFPEWPFGLSGIRNPDPDFFDLPDPSKYIRSGVRNASSVFIGYQQSSSATQSSLATLSSRYIFIAPRYHFSYIVFGLIIDWPCCFYCVLYMPNCVWVFS